MTRRSLEVAGCWLSPPRNDRMWHNGIVALAQIHAVDWRGLGLEFLDAPEHSSGIDGQLLLWCRTFDWAAEGEPNPTVEAALTWLEMHRPDDDQERSSTGAPRWSLRVSEDMPAWFANAEG